MGTICGTSRVLIDQLRKKGEKAGLIKVKSFRPFPGEELKKATENTNTLAVIDRSISLGYEGPLCSEVKSSLYGQKTKISGFIAGLGGRDVTISHLNKALSKAGKTKKTEWLQ